MTIQQLQYVIEVVKTGSISNASRNLFVTQAGISQAITKLEEELGMKIFEREKTGSTLTMEGEAIIEDIFNIINKVERLKENANIQKNIVTGNLKISATASLFMTVLSDILPIFKKDYPGVNIDISVSNLQDVIANVKKSEVDIGLCVIDDHVKQEENFIYETLFSGHINVCVSKYSELAQYETLHAKQMIHYPVVLASGIYMKKQIQQLFNPYGSIEILFKSNNNEVLKRAVSDNLAISFFVDLALKNDPYILNGNIIKKTIVNFETEVPFGWVRQKGKYMSFIEKEFLNYVSAIIVKKYSQ